MEAKRLEKINRLIQKDLAEILRQKSSSEFLNAMISVTKVSVTNDLSLARVYVSVFSIDKQNSGQTILSIVKRKKDLVRMLLGQKERFMLRVIPDLVFYLDDTLEYANRIDELLKK